MTSDMHQDIGDSGYEATTRSIRVCVEPAYLEDESSPGDDYFFWAYTVKIANFGKEPVQLRTRYWKITDGLGRIQEVHGRGVAGEEPLLEPGESFSYTSGAPLPTPTGFMTGCYQMERPTGELFNVEIPPFSLDHPDIQRTVN